MRSKCPYCKLKLKHANPKPLFSKLYHIECERDIRYLKAKYGEKAYKLLMGEL